MVRHQQQKITKDGNKCVDGSGNCKHSNIYVGVDGICILRNCTDRNSTKNTLIFPCGYVHGDNCVLDGDLNCQTSCSNTNHYKSVNGICELKTCNERESDGNKLNPCGNGCVQNVSEEKSGKCQYVCDIGYKNENGICLLSAESKESNAMNYLSIIIPLVVVIVILVVIIIIVIVVKLNNKINNTSIEGINNNSEKNKESLIFNLILFYV
jgi:hypothetical protein